MSVLLTLRQMTTPLPPFVYLRTEHEDTLVESSLFARIPCSWFFNTFVAMKLPTPVDFKGEARVPVYGIPLPDHVLRAMMNALRFPELLPDLFKHLPWSYGKEKMNLYTWQRYLADMGLDQFEEEDEEEKEAKRRRLEEEKMAKETPERRLQRRVAKALAESLRDGHPAFAKLLTGEITSLRAQYVYTQVADGPDGNFYDVLPIPGDPPVEPIQVAWFVGAKHGRELHDVFRDYFVAALKASVPAIPSINACSVFTAPKAKRKNGIPITHWPSAARGHDLTEGYHNVLEVHVFTK